MFKSNLLQLINKFTIPEFKEFGEYVRSGFFNKNEGIVKLYDYIKTYYPDFEEKNFEKELVYKRLFPDVKYDDAFMRKLMFNMMKLAEDYLAYKNFTSEYFNYSKSLLDELFKKDLTKLYLKKLRAIETEFEKVKVKDYIYYKNKFMIDSLKERVVMDEPTIINSKDKPDEYIINYTNSLIEYFLVEILNEYSFLTNFKKIVKFDHDFQFCDFLLDYLKKNESALNTPLISMYYYSIMLVNEKDKKYFLKLKDLVLSEMETFGWHDKFATFAFLVNFTNDEYHKGKKEYLEESFSLYKLILEHKLYKSRDEGFFYAPLFKNIVNAGVQMKELEWTERFISKYIDELNHDSRDNTLHFSNARINFAKRQYERALEDLSKISSISYFQFKPQIKVLTLMIYTEKELYNESFDLLDSFRHYISYDKLLPPLSKEKNINFIKFCGDILKIKSRNSKEKISDFKFDLINTENILEKEWLMEKIEELE